MPRLDRTVDGFAWDYSIQIKHSLARAWSRASKNGTSSYRSFNDLPAYSTVALSRKTALEPRVVAHPHSGQNQACEKKSCDRFCW